MSASPFRTHIRAALADDNLQTALDANAERRSSGRMAAFASLPDWPARRQRAHAVRAEVIAHLDEYLAALCARVMENSIEVHRAANADEAIQLVLAIAAGTTGRGDAQGSQVLFAKSKSMVSEEIELNRALERQGHRVVETDLGEYIVQLRGEKPAHIITPAVHLRRRQVGELFQEKLGIEYTDDIPALTAVARRVLREIFLTADVGISGINFAVAETGTLCIVTNEGNGRMVTTMPPVHIALMGMERLLPTLDDLALMLSLLPRSATGQKLSVYTQLIHSPRRLPEVDGATQRHLIILDNGRSRLSRSALREALYCIRCGACLNACPVFREIGGHAYVGTGGEPAPYPGPIGSIVSPGLLGPAEFGQLAQASSLCGSCKDACPVDIDLPRLLTRVRAGSWVAPGSRTGTGLSTLSRIGLLAYGAVGASPLLFGISQRLAALGAWMISPRSEWMRLPDFTGWGPSKDFPRPARRPFRARWDGRQPAAPARDGILKFPAVKQKSPTPAARPSQVEESFPAPGGAEAVERFIVELQAVGGLAYRSSIHALQSDLLAFLREHSIEALLAWDQIAGLDPVTMLQAGFRIVPSPSPDVPAGITGCACAIAETGTLVLTSGAGQPMTASLLPEVHVAIVRSDQVVWNLEAALKRPEVRQSSAAVLITGPSRTADIEMTLTIGVHGPRELVVFIVE